MTHGAATHNMRPRVFVGTCFSQSCFFYVVVQAESKARKVLPRPSVVVVVLRLRVEDDAFLFFSSQSGAPATEAAACPRTRRAGYIAKIEGLFEFPSKLGARSCISGARGDFGWCSDTLRNCLLFLVDFIRESMFCSSAAS